MVMMKGAPISCAMLNGKPPIAFDTPTNRAGEFGCSLDSIPLSCPECQPSIGISDG